MAPAGLLHPQTDVALELVEGDIYNGQYRPNASDRQLQSREQISAVWPEQPSYDNLHVFITLPPGGERITFVTPPLSTHMLVFRQARPQVRCFSSFLNILRCHLLRASVLFYYFIFFALSQLRMLESGCPNLILEMMDEVNGRKYYRRSQESQKVSN